NHTKHVVRHATPTQPDHEADTARPSPDHSLRGPVERCAGEFPRRGVAAAGGRDVLCPHRRAVVADVRTEADVLARPEPGAAHAVGTKPESRPTAKCHRVPAGGPS